MDNEQNNTYDTIQENEISNENNITLEDNYINQSNINEINLMNSKTNTHVLGHDYKLNHKGLPFIVTLKDIYGNPLSSETIIFTIHGVSYSRVCQEDGSARLNINLEYGTYPITYTYQGNTFYNPCSGSATISMINYKLQPSLSGLDISKYYGDSNQYVVTLKDNNQNPMKNCNINIKINGITYTKITNDNGKVFQNINLYSGKYTVSTTYLGNNYYYGSSITNTINVNRKATSLSGNDLTKYYGNPEPYKVKLVDYKNNVLNNKDVQITIHGVTYTKTTDNKGYATLNINLQEGKYIASSVYSGDEYYSNSNHVNNVIIIKKSTYLIANNLNKYFDETSKFNVKLTDGNTGIANKNLIFTINNEEYTKTTDNNGNAFININSNHIGKYKISITFNGDDYYKSSSIIKEINVNKHPTTLYTNDLKLFIEENKTKCFNITLKDNWNRGLSNQLINININNTNYSLKTDTHGQVSLKIVLKPGTYKITSKYAGNDYYMPSNKINNIIVDSNIFKYTILIPNYLNVTNFGWLIKAGWLKSEYIASGGITGNIKIPVTRLLNIVTNTKEYQYYTGMQKSDGDSGFEDIDFKTTKIIKLDNTGLSNITITSNQNNTNITYYGFLNNGTNQFSAIYKQKEQSNMTIPNFEENIIVINGIKKISIGFSNPCQLDETGVRFGLIKNDMGHNPDVMVRPYNKFNGYNNLQFAETKEHLNYTDNMQKIGNLPSKESIITAFNFKDYQVLKKEHVSFGKYYDRKNGFEVIQSYAITNQKITNNTIIHYLNQNRSYPIGGMKASYGTFLTALSTIWLSDFFADLYSQKYNVTWNRNSNIIVMCGVNNNESAYIHSLNASMSMNINSNNQTNVIGFRFVNSLALSKLENIALSFAGNSSNCSLELLCNSIINNNFTILKNKDTFSIMSTDGSNSYITINTTTGLVYDILFKDDFCYKGVYSNNLFTCFHDNLTDNLIKNLKNCVNNIMNVITDFGDFFEAIRKTNTNATFFEIIDMKAGIELSIGTNGLLGCTSILEAMGSAVSLMIGYGEFTVQVRNDLKPMDTWQYFSYHPSLIQDRTKTFCFKDNNGYEAFIEVPVLSDGRLDRDNAIYINSKNGARKMDRNKTYSYFKHDKIDAWDYLGYNALR